MGPAAALYKVRVLPLGGLSMTSSVDHVALLGIAIREIGEMDHPPSLGVGEGAPVDRPIEHRGPVAARAEQPAHESTGMYIAFAVDREDGAAHPIVVEGVSADDV